MVKRNLIARVLAIAGTVLVWLPILAPVVFAVIAGVRRERVLFDYLLPAELFPSTLAGGALLVAAAVLARSRRWLVIACLAAAVALLVGSQWLAVATGLASGEIEPRGWQFVLVSALFAGFVLATVVLGVGGALLIRDTFRKPTAAA